jgi:eukaryotic-like serine/threonine-protein kinase
MSPVRQLADDRYNIKRRIGHGGMATVYLAQDRKLGRPVAIKLLADNLAGDDDVRRRFMREARLAAKLDHPNVVQVFDVGEDGDRPYIVMEHVGGGTLDDLIQKRRRGVPASEAVPLLMQMCEGLGHAHSRKLVHRDVKPQNMLLRSEDGQLKIADFGIARAAEETRLTKTGHVVGTERYMAPEQLSDGKITPATDVYGCGVVAQELLQSRAAPELRPILDKCLREDPRDRYSDATELCHALSAAAGEETAGRVTVPLRGGEGGRPAPETKATELLERTRARRAPGTARRLPQVRVGTGLAAALALGAIAIVGLIFALGSGDEPSGTSAGDQGSGARVEPAPRVEDPADQARALADWLRSQGR